MDSKLLLLGYEILIILHNPAGVSNQSSGLVCVWNPGIHERANNIIFPISNCNPATSYFHYLSVSLSVCLLLSDCVTLD